MYMYAYNCTVTTWPTQPHHFHGGLQKPVLASCVSGATHLYGKRLAARPPHTRTLFYVIQRIG